MTIIIIYQNTFLPSFQLQWCFYNKQLHLARYICWESPGRVRCLAHIVSHGHENWNFGIACSCPSTPRGSAVDELRRCCKIHGLWESFPLWFYARLYEMILFHRQLQEPNKNSRRVKTRSKEIERIIKGFWNWTLKSNIIAEMLN